MKKLIAAAFSLLVAVSPAWSQPAAQETFAALNKEIDALPGAARGAAFVAAVLKVSERCEPGGATPRALKVSFAKLVRYASPAVSQDVLARALGLGTRVSMTLTAMPGFQCATSGLAVRAGQVPALVAAEMKRAPDPRRFDSDRITVIAR